MRPHDVTLRAELEALLAAVERVSRLAADTRKRAADRHRLGGSELDARLAPYFARVVLPALEKLSPRIASARLRLDALDELPGALVHAEFKALATLADRIGAARASLLAADLRARSSRERRRRARDGATMRSARVGIA